MRLEGVFAGWGEHCMDRRTLVKAGAAAGALAAAGSALAKSRRSTALTFLLVHGAWHGGWCWRDVAASLRAKGHRVYTPTLTGLGERYHLGRPDMTIDTHVEDIKAVISCEELSDVILVGHSYGGKIIAGASDALPKSTKLAIYLDALVPDPAEQPFVFTDDMRKSFVDGWRIPSFPPEAFGIPKDHPGYAWVARRVTAMPMGVFGTPLRLTDAWTKVPRAYIECTRNQLPQVIEGGKRAKAQGWAYYTLNDGHDPMVTGPAALTALLLKIAKSA
jgi:pimeloyl-ACP methyl ester carboxylesterase